MKPLLFAVIACVTLALTGCGSDSETKDSNKDAEPKTLTKAEFTSQANAICKAGTKTMDDAEKTSFVDPENPTEAEFKTAVEDVLVPAFKKQAADLRELEPPAADAKAVDAMLDSLEDDIAKVDADWQLIGEDATFSEASAAALKLGLTDCGEE